MPIQVTTARDNAQVSGRTVTRNSRAGSVKTIRTSKNPVKGII